MEKPIKPRLTAVECLINEAALKDQLVHPVWNNVFTILFFTTNIK